MWLLESAQRERSTKQEEARDDQKLRTTHTPKISQGGQEEWYSFVPAGARAGHDKCEKVGATGIEPGTTIPSKDRSARAPRANHKCLHHYATQDQCKTNTCDTILNNDRSSYLPASSCAFLSVPPNRRHSALRAGQFSRWQAGPQYRPCMQPW
jgi:hypothetical protein